MNPATNQSSNSARTAILKSISDHLAQSAKRGTVNHQEKPSRFEIAETNANQVSTSHPLVRRFRQELEAVGGHCVIVGSQPEAARALNAIITKLQTDSSRALRIALSDAPILEHLTRAAGLESS